jgi:CRISPR type I-E-associated protein CasB/Cse2
VGLRKGGPLTTLILEPGSLWRTLWANVLPNGEFFSGQRSSDRNSPSGSAHIFPWLAPPRLPAHKRDQVHADDVHPLQVYWATPRRIRLIREEVEGRCDICLEQVRGIHRTFLQVPGGVDYGEYFRHPLSPHCSKKPTEDSPDDRAPISGKSDLLYYRHLLGFLYDDDQQGASRTPAMAVRRFLGRFLDAEVRLWVFGFEMERAKARAWCEATFPIVHADADSRDDLVTQAAALTRGAEQALDHLVDAAKVVIVGSRKERAKKLNLADHVLVHRFWQATEGDFYRLLRQSAHRLPDPEGLQALRAEWLKKLQATCLRLFEEFATEGVLRAIEPRHVFVAKKNLKNRLWARNLRQQLDLPRNSNRSWPKEGRMPSDSPSTSYSILGPFGRAEEDAAARKALLGWHRQLDEHYRGDRARLRRARDATEILLEPAVYRLRRRLAKEADVRIGSSRQTHFAIMVALLASVREHAAARHGLGGWLAQPKAGGRSPTLSELRFRRILAIEEPEALLAPFRRIVRLFGGRIDLFALAQAIYRWDGPTRIRLAEQYYERAHIED